MNKTEHTLLLSGQEISEVSDIAFGDEVRFPSFIMIAPSLTTPGNNTFDLRRNSDGKTVPIQITGFHMNDGHQAWTGIIHVA